MRCSWRGRHNLKGGIRWPATTDKKIQKFDIATNIFKSTVLSSSCRRNNPTVATHLSVKYHAWRCFAHCRWNPKLNKQFFILLGDACIVKALARAGYRQSFEPFLLLNSERREWVAFSDYKRMNHEVWFYYQWISIASQGFKIFLPRRAQS